MSHRNTVLFVWVLRGWSMGGLRGWFMGPVARLVDEVNHAAPVLVDQPAPAGRLIKCVVIVSGVFPPPASCRSARLLLRIGDVRRLPWADPER